MNMDNITIPVLDNPKHVIRVKVIHPDEWPAPEPGTELLVGVYEKTFFLFHSWSFWMYHDFYQAYRVNAAEGEERIQQTVDLVAQRYRATNATRAAAKQYVSA